MRDLEDTWGEMWRKLLKTGWQFRQEARTGTALSQSHRESNQDKEGTRAGFQRKRVGVRLGKKLEQGAR